MSTHATVIIRQDGIYVGCYVHFDGYPAGVGRVLGADFNNKHAATMLVLMGMVESIKIGGFITEWQDKSEKQSPTFGATIEAVVQKTGGYHVYVYAEPEGWTHDKVRFNPKTFRRDKQWKYKGTPLAKAVHDDLAARGLLPKILA